MASRSGTEAATAPGATAAAGAAAEAVRAAAAASPSAASPATSGRSGKGDQASRPMATEIDAFRVECLMNARYHATREAFLDSVHRWLMFGVIVSGAVPVLDFFAIMGGIASAPSAHGVEASAVVKAVMGAGALLFGALDLVFDLSNRARAHALMKRRYFELLADVVDGQKDLVHATACMNRFSADEEPAYHAVIASAWNAAQQMVYGKEAYKCKLPPLHAFFKNFRRFEGTNYDVIRPTT
jgi:hypothetical protein